MSKSWGRTNTRASPARVLSCSMATLANETRPTSARPRNWLTLPRKLMTNSVRGRWKTSSGHPTCSTPPWFITTTRSATSSASSWSCVTNTLDTLSSSWSRRSHRRSSWRTLASSAPNGSSSRSTLGSMASARASATRWRWPPERWWGWRSESPSSWTRRRRLPTFVRISCSDGRAARGRTLSPKATFSNTLMWRNRA